MVWWVPYQVGHQANKHIVNVPVRVKKRRARKRRNKQQSSTQQFTCRCRRFQHTLTRRPSRCEVCLPPPCRRLPSTLPLLSHSPTFEGRAKKKKKLDDEAFLMHHTSWHICIVTLQMATVTRQVSKEDAFLAHIYGAVTSLFMDMNRLLNRIYVTTNMDNPLVYVDIH